ncbi:16S rRNA (uracil(1498)-N(3))-methyltransferase [Brevibacillus daliensis]|uniref:16S rRNA (uracil(1498)-N(3))-methyltransferase n=1 Tax=Brevibacillus daliensis TaxID=2892995 RepID=UPI001E374DA3|nr:16S rRNA (uracil(1498)-N(3))-methyltransferase [Brevibacillus daliensis]
MQRYFIDSQQFFDHHVVITGDDVHHLVKVMRAEIGELIWVSDGRGRVVKARLSALDTKEVRADIMEDVQQETELPIQVTIAQGLPKGDKLEWILQKGTELGATAFLPFQSERTIVKLDAKKEPKKLERWNKIVKEAAEQSHRAYLPEVKASVSFKQVMELAKGYSKAMIAYEKEDTKRMGEALQDLQPGDSLLVIIGPEGGLSEAEVRLAEANGITSVSLGPRILRTETASQYVLSAISYQFEQV